MGEDLRRVIYDPNGRRRGARNSHEQTGVELDSARTIPGELQGPNDLFATLHRYRWLVLSTCFMIGAGAAAVYYDFGNSQQTLHKEIRSK